MDDPSHSEYDCITIDYQHSKNLRFRQFIEGPLLFDLICDVQGKDILDLACGEGIYSRQLINLGANSVVGVDLSEEMIKLARTIDEREPLGIRYMVADAATLGKVGSFDFVVGSYILNHASNIETLESFCETISSNLKPGGRFIGINNNPNSDPEAGVRYRKYGFTKATRSPISEGDVITYIFYRDDGSEFSFNNYYLSTETHESVFRRFFYKFEWRQPVVTEQGVKAFPEGYWEDFQNDPPIIGIVAEAI